ncbi:hypothetical protein [Streptacidiphilus fuscans]|uniref:Uncharacterized protein n=1 Tax=Streptacidiphilus fuscans TaxID=2789292 RepID=A0A931B078_9ACTN|nr:hypothetical protein [Streptacidiphilus fuscans]MBF9067828.1 hypothetical protein [Streptacidiphilus fuscans]
MRAGVAAKTMGHTGDTKPTGEQARDPFAPPPEGAPDRPWQPRLPAPVATGHVHASSDGTGSGAGSNGGAGSSSGAGAGADAGSQGHNGAPPQDARPGQAQPGQGQPSQGQSGQTGQTGQGHGQEGQPPQDQPPTRGRAQVPPPHPWSPGYQGQQPPLPRFYQQQPRFDPSDPVQRRARYALLSGMWGFLFLILGVPYLTLLLGALALYWGISALRGTAKTPQNAAATPSIFQSPGAGAAANARPQAPQQAHQTGQAAQPGWPGQGVGHSGYYPTAPVKPQAPAAIGGLIAGAVSLALVAVVFGVQLYYKSYYDCQANAPTKQSYSQCATSVTPRPPAWLVQLNGG